MAQISETPFGTWGPKYDGRGFYARPLKHPGVDTRTGKPLGKMCFEKGWQTPNPELPPERIAEWYKKHAAYNIGLLLGSPFPDGTVLAALDVDHDDYVELAEALLKDQICGRIGSKGAAFFVRCSPSLSSQKFRVKGDIGKEYGQVCEFFCAGSQIAIPPSIHPDTKQPYRWIDKSLLEIDYTDLPLIGE